MTAKRAKKAARKKAATKSTPKAANGGKTIDVSSLDDRIYAACDIMRRSNCSGAINYVPELSWILFLRILDELDEAEEARATALGLGYMPPLASPYRWRDWAAPFRDEDGGCEDTPGWKRRRLTEGPLNTFRNWVNGDLIPHLKGLRDRPGATPKQKVISEVLSGVAATRIDTERNLLDVLDQVHGIHPGEIDQRHMFTLSQVYEGLLADLGEKAGDGGQFFTPREIVRAVVKVINPKIGETVYDPCCGTGGFLAQAFEHMAGEDWGNIKSARDLETLQQETFFGREKENLIYPVGLANLVLHGIHSPNLWHGNSLSGEAFYGGLWQEVPPQFDVVFSNPPFGGKEGKDVQARFPFKTRATQVLFLQLFIDALKPGGRCGIVLDEGLLFRTNETAFVRTKRRLLEECDVFCIVSLPGGAFSAAGAGVKTNLVFFHKGGPTSRIWYYDLSDVKVGKRTPFTLERFDDFFRLLPGLGDSGRSWTVDFEARRAEATERAAPFQAEAARHRRRIDGLKAERKARNGTKGAKKKLAAIDEAIAEASNAAREATNRATAIEEAVYDLKAVNPHAAGTADSRTPLELLRVIEQQEVIVNQALTRLHEQFSRDS